MAKYKKKKHGGFVDRLIMGKEKSEGYARASLPSNRWELFFDILKGNLGKIILINLLVAIFFIPLILLIVFRYTYSVNLGMQYPFSQGFGIGYQAMISLIGLEEAVAFNSNLISFLFMPIAMLIAAVGLSGGAYTMRNMVWTEGVFVVNDFWKGIRENFKIVALICCVFSVVFYISILAISMINVYLAGASSLKWLLTISKIICMIVICIYSIMTLHMISMSVTYEMRFGQLLKNSFYTTFALLLNSVFFIMLGALPFGIMLLGDFFKGIGIIIIILFAFSFFLLAWTDFSQWIYDKYFNDKVAGAKKNRGIYAKVENDNGKKDMRKIKEQMEIASLSSLSSKPIKPITDDELKLAELPTNFSRSDIEKLNESRKELYEDNEKYVQEHSGDLKYTQLEKAKEGLALEEQERKKRMEQAKKELEKRIKKKR